MRVPPKALALAAVALLVAIPSLASDPSTQEQQTVEGAPEVAQPADDSVVPARVVSKTQKAPIYPPAALAARFEGTVSVLITIGGDGKISDVKVTDCDHPNVGFEDASLKAVSEWEFTPAKKDGQPVEYQSSYSLSFRLGGRGGSGRVLILAGTTGTDANQVRQAGLPKIPPPPPSSAAPKR